MCSVKNGLSIILQSSQENTSVGVFFCQSLCFAPGLQYRIRYSCFPVDLVKLLTILFL